MRSVTPQRIHVGRDRAPVVIVDGITGDLPAIRATAAALAPYPSVSRVAYPGLRRIIGDADSAANAYVTRLLEAAAPFIGGGFDVDEFDLVEASFSLVTTPRGALTSAQRAPHFDSTDRRYLAVLHYLSDTPGTGTAFYRQRATGIEQVSQENSARFLATAHAAQPPPGYIVTSNRDYEQIGAVDGHPDRLLIYQGCLLHSGIIPPELPLSPDPLAGRLTANLFLQAR